MLSLAPPIQISGSSLSRRSPGSAYWDANARGALFGITAATGRAEFARAALEAAAYQTRALVDAMRADLPSSEATPIVLRVDGGMAANDWMLQFLADMLGAPVERPDSLEATVRGAAYLAGLTAGICPPPDATAQSPALGRRFDPKMDAGTRERNYAAWQDAVARVLGRGKA
jgi:glycerol kinase